MNKNSVIQFNHLKYEQMYKDFLRWKNHQRGMGHILFGNSRGFDVGQSIHSVAFEEGSRFLKGVLTFFVSYAGIAFAR